MAGERVLTYRLRAQSLSQARIVGNPSGEFADAIDTERLGQYPSAEAVALWFVRDGIRGSPHRMPPFRHVFDEPDP
jgi:hypothetical protein